ncbi:MAG: fused MFS/spermidine synthase [Planctomycetota bacterium]
MNRQFFLALVIASAALVAGIKFNDQHYRLNQPYHPADQVVIAHRDSPYTSMTWVESPSNNYRQLRFFDRVEGGVCLQPSWAEIAAMPGLEHLRPAAPVVAAGMGTLNNSPYISFFPAGLLLNRDGVPTAPQVLIVGLGSGVGLAQLAHHFPQVAIDVVDIDVAVIAMVREHFPLLAWLETQKTAAGLPRLRFVANDARAYIRSRKGHGYHMVVLDAYTAGSTIPPHLMTLEFFAQTADTLAVGGVVLANIIGCYGEAAADGGVNGAAHRVLGGALRSMRAANLPHAWCIPVMREREEPSKFDLSHQRNTIVIAAKHDISPRGCKAGWERLAAWVPFPQFATDRYVSQQIAVLAEIGDGTRAWSSFVPLEWVNSTVPKLSSAWHESKSPPTSPLHTQIKYTNDSHVIQSVASEVLKHSGHLVGWDSLPARCSLQLRITDWTLFPRETWRVCIGFARDGLRHDPEALVGPVDGPARDSAIPSWHMLDAPLFTDQTPNADIMNH